MGQLEFFFFRRKQARKKRDEAQERGAKKGSSHQKDECLTLECVDALRKMGMGELSSRVVVVWNRRMQTTAGRAFWPDAIIELNPKLVEVAPDEVARTLLHELAHLVAYARSGRRRISAHGVEWQQACADLGIPGERATHSLPLSGRKMQRKWSYTCSACGEGFERVRKMKQRAGCYPCCKKLNGGYYDKRFRLKEEFLG